MMSSHTLFSVGKSSTCAFSMKSLLSKTKVSVLNGAFFNRTHPNYIVNVTLDTNSLNGETNNDGANRILEWLAQDPIRYQGLLDEGDTLSGVLATGRLFMVDYSSMYECNKAKQSMDDFWLMAPVCLMYSSLKLCRMLPLAIEIGPEMFCSPSSSKGAWLFGRAAVRSADTVAHSLSGHFLGTHLISEVLGVALHRILPQTHVLYKLLRPHFVETYFVNTVFRNLFLSRNGVIPRTHGISSMDIKSFLCREWPNRSVMNSLIFHRDLKTRGVADETTLPDYPYRDDGILLWSALELYVIACLGTSYCSDDEVANDTDLQAWLHEIADVGFGGHTDFPSRLVSKDSLVELVTGILFTVTATHGSMNYNMFEMYGFAPFSPTMIMKRPPSTQTELDKIVTESDFLSFLPTSVLSEIIQNVSASLSRSPEESLGEGLHMEFNGFSSQVAALREDLSLVDRAIQLRNKSRFVAYDVLRPSKLPNSVQL